MGGGGGASLRPALGSSVSHGTAPTPLKAILLVRLTMHGTAVAGAGEDFGELGDDDLGDVDDDWGLDGEEGDDEATTA